MNYAGCGHVRHIPKFLRLPTTMSVIHNYSLYAIPVFSLLALAPHAYVVATITGKIGFDNAAPRGNLQRLKDKDSRLSARLQRAHAASDNGYENFPIIASALILGNAARLDNSLLNNFAATIIGLRVAYVAIYINHETSAVGWIRTAIYFAQYFPALWLMTKAAQKFALE